MSLEKLSQDIFDAYSEQWDTGRPFFGRFAGEIGCYNPVDVLTYQMKKYDLRYSIEFFLSNCELWLPFKIGDWCQIMQAMSPRKMHPVLFNESGGFADFHICLTYIGINIIPLYIGLLEVSREDKITVLNYCMGRAQILERDEHRFEDMNGLIYVSRGDVEEVRDMFLRNGYVKFGHDSQEIRESVRDLRLLI